MESVLERAGTTTIMLDDNEMQRASDTALNEIKDVRAQVVLKNGEITCELPGRLSSLVMHVLEGVSRGDRITISVTPAEVSAPTAADMLGISRPTFLKWAKKKGLTVRVVGSQKRFRTKDVLELRKERVKQQIAVYDGLRDEMAQYGV